MLPKKERLSREEFNRFFSVGKRFSAPSLQVVYVSNPTFHASVVVPKKVAKRAVVRNKIRRRIYDIVRRHKSVLENRGVFIFFTKTGIERKSYAQLKEDVESVLGTILEKINHT